MSLWNNFSFNLAVLINLIVALMYPFPVKAELDPRLSAILWAVLFFSIASIVHFPGRYGFYLLISTIIIRSIYMIGIQPTLGILGSINVFIKTIHLISIMGNHGTFNKEWSKLLTDREFLYHIFYLFCCIVGLCIHPLFYSVLVNLFGPFGPIQLILIV